MVAANPTQPALYGRSLLYADTYTSSTNESTHVYCGHRIDPIGFFRILDNFLFEQLSDFPEFRNRPFDLIVSKAGALTEVSVHLPFLPSLGVDQLALEPNKVEFLRVYIPFGDVTVSFGESATIKDELECIRTGCLSSFLDAPLIGCDMTKSIILVTLMARLHWASGVLSESTLENLIGQLSFNPVAA